MVFRIYHIPSDKFARNYDMFNCEALLEFTKESDAKAHIRDIVKINNDFANDFDEASWIEEEFIIVPFKEGNHPVTWATRNVRL